MDGFFGSLQVEAPDSLVEAVILCASLVAAFVTFRRFGTGAAVLTTSGALGAFVQTGHPSIPVAVAIAGVALRRQPEAGVRRGMGGAFARELALILGGFTLYELARFYVVSDAGPAEANSLRIIDFERSLGLFREASVQEWFTASESIDRLLSAFYSHGFLAVVVGAIVWLHFADSGRYRLYRNALGVSTILAVLLIAVFPAAPPRLMHELGIEDTVIRLGREHKFANEYAAIPSLHVGWMALTGYVLALPYRGRRFWATFLPLPFLMQVTVVTTGNHFWVDGVVGSAIALGPALAFRHARDVVALWRSRPALSTGAMARVRYSSLSLGALLLYLMVARMLQPGFTAFWGYLLFQVAASLVLLAAGELLLANRGGLSPLTHGVAVVCSFADVLGTDGNLYARIDEYDKLTHFMGTAAITAATFDVLRGLNFGRRLASADRMMLAIAVGVTAGFGWEVYEYLGDRVFHSTRVQGEWDTLNDLVSDALGAVTIAWLLRFQERSGGVPAEVPVGVEGSDSSPP